jgi:DNA-binding transcriptional ArsR family regulator
MAAASLPERTQIDVRDPKAMRALANPLRLRILGLLRASGPHSVGELSELADAAPGSVSYHLSTLEKFGFVEEAPENARDGRERWWRARHQATHYEPSELLADPESAAAGRAMRQSFLHGHLTEQLAYLDGEAALPIEWVKGATAGDTMAYLTAEELRSFSDEINSLAEKWDAYKDSARPGVAPVRFIYASFRQP